MIKDFTTPARDYHQNYLREAIEYAETDAMRRRARATRLRDRLGKRLIAIGERLVETPTSERAILDRAA